MTCHGHYLCSSSILVHYLSRPYVLLFCMRVSVRVRENMSYAACMRYVSVDG